MSEPETTSPVPEDASSAGPREGGGEPAGVPAGVPAGSAGGVVMSRPRKAWLTKNLIFLPLVLGFGIWSWYDGFVLYPDRGELFASFKEKEYLQALYDISPTELSLQASVAEPREALADLNRRAGDLAEQEASGATGMRKQEAAVELRRRDWLAALEIINRVDPAHTTYAVPGAENPLNRPEPDDRLVELDEQLRGKTSPSALQKWDIPVQYVFLIGSALIAANIIRLLVGVASNRYRWDPATKRLTMPDGTTFVPSELAEPLDKRKWHKFIVTATLAAHHEKGGSVVRFDTYRHDLVETWLLEMERTQFPWVVDEGSAGQDTPAGEPAGGPSEGSASGEGVERPG